MRTTFSTLLNLKHQAPGLLVARALVVLAPQRVLDVISPSIRLVGLERVDVTQDRPQCHHTLSGGHVNRLELPKNRLELPKSRYRIDVPRLTQTSICLIGLLASSLPLSHFSPHLSSCYARDMTLRLRRPSPEFCNCNWYKGGQRPGGWAGGLAGDHQNAL